MPLDLSESSSDRYDVGDGELKTLLDELRGRFGYSNESLAKVMKITSEEFAGLEDGSVTSISQAALVALLDCLAEELAGTDASKGSHYIDPSRMEKDHPSLVHRLTSAGIFLIAENGISNAICYRAYNLAKDKDALKGLRREMKILKKGLRAMLPNSELNKLQCKALFIKLKMFLEKKCEEYSGYMKEAMQSQDHGLLGTYVGSYLFDFENDGPWSRAIQMLQKCDHALQVDTAIGYRHALRYIRFVTKARER